MAKLTKLYETDEIFYFSENIYHDDFKYIQWNYQDEYDIGFPGTTYDLKIWRLGQQIANRVSVAASVHMAHPYKTA